MIEIFFIRHGQASFGKDNYDVLSDKGKLQAEKLAEYFQNEKIIPDKIFTGSLVRQKETAKSTSKSFSDLKIIESSSLNEFKREFWKDSAEEISKIKPEFSNLYNLYKKKLLANPKQSRIIFFDLTERILKYWKDGGKIPKHPLYSEFKTNILSFYDTICNEKSKTRIFAFSSGTPISILVSHALGIHEGSELKLLPLICNTSITKILYKKNEFFCEFINSTPHLMTKERTLI
ncbi:MAG: histidine phosphatase family protein [Leptospiraceae bacterium]|nr:histidine phosphatase family protein [Leptospiraceae bacterium]